MDRLAVELTSQGRRFVRTREPGGTALGDEIREMILRTSGQAPSARTELLLYEASRSQHVDFVIRPALEDKVWVLCDRFTASSIAFQAGGRSLDEAWVERLNAFATDGIEPDLTILLDLSVEESRARRQRRMQEMGMVLDRIELEADSFHERVRQAFLRISRKNPSKWLVLDASHSLEDLSEQTLQHLRDLQWLDF